MNYSAKIVYNKVRDRLYKIDSHRSGYFYFHYMIGALANYIVHGETKGYFKIKHLNNFNKSNYPNNYDYSDNDPALELWSIKNAEKKTFSY